MNASAVEYEEKRTATAQIFRDLAMEMLELAVLDLSRPEPDALDRTQAASARRADRRSAMLWVSGSGDRGVVPFSLCCDALNVPLDSMREAAISDPQRVLAHIRAISAGEAQSLGRAEVAKTPAAKAALPRLR